jgi:hypothetical protein
MTTLSLPALPSCYFNLETANMAMSILGKLDYDPWLLTYYWQIQMKMSHAYFLFISVDYVN